MVISAEFDTGEGKWVVKTQDGRTCKARFMIVAAGFAAKRYVPDFEGSLETFKGVIHHSSFWPEEGLPFDGKRVAVIGTGASGVQIIQEMGATASELTVYQRTPNLALPMGRRSLSKEEQDNLKPFYPEILAYRERCFAGFHYDLNERNTFDDSPEEREAFFEDLWKRAGFSLWLGGYKDYLFDDKSNDQAYNFWRKKQSGRVKNETKKKILFPEKKPHPFGVKRPCLEQNYYETLDKDNVEVVDISPSGTPIMAFTKNGIKTSDGKEREYDIIVLATGFDVVTGGMTSMGLKSINGTYLQDEWKAAANTYLGKTSSRSHMSCPRSQSPPLLFTSLYRRPSPSPEYLLVNLLTNSTGVTISGYPNMFHLYGPHGPTLLSNGPSTVEVQGRWIRDAINQAVRQELKYVNPKKQASDDWKKRINDLAAPTLFPTTRSTYMGGTVPGKAFEMTCYAGGVGGYHDEIRGALTGWKGFETVKA